MVMFSTSTFSGCNRLSFFSSVGSGSCRFHGIETVAFKARWKKRVKRGGREGERGVKFFLLDFSPGLHTVLCCLLHSSERVLKCPGDCSFLPSNKKTTRSE